MRFIDVPEKTVEFEDGSTDRVPAFAISQYCVTIEQFLDFQRTTGHVTSAEKDDRGKLFLLNELVEHMPEADRRDETAFCLSYVDASEYCRWVGARLPTEAEWLAAAIVDDRVYDVDAGEECPWCDKCGNLVLSKLTAYPRLVYDEITSTRTGDGLVVVRSGPQFYRESNWQECVDENRRLRAPGEWDLMMSFRVCR